MLKLVSLTFDDAPRIPGVRPGAMIKIECDKPHVSLTGWRIILRGASLFFVSPRGWRPGLQPHEWNTESASAIHEIPRMHCFLEWEGDQADIDAVIAKGKYETPPFGSATTVAPVAKGGILSQLDASQLGDP